MILKYDRASLKKVMITIYADSAYNGEPVLKELFLKRVVPCL